jgi:murein tripeptide amidase MpaA
MGLKNLVANGLLARSVLGQIVYAGNTRPFTPDSPAVSTNFPEPNITLYSPAFSSPDTVPDEFSNGTAAPTSEETLIRFLQTLSERNEWMTYMTPNFTSEEGRKIPYVLLSFGPSNGTAKGKDKLRIYVHGSMHGDEPGGEAGVSAFLGKLDNEPQWAASVLDKADLLVLPRYNADGVL